MKHLLSIALLTIVWIVIIEPHDMLRVGIIPLVTPRETEAQKGDITCPRANG